MSFYPPNIPRCRHIKVNGTQCGSPALHHRKFCYFHTQQHREHINLYNRNRAADARPITLPILEDAESVQVALMQVIRLILSGQIDGKTAGLLLYALQTASTNLKRTHFEPATHEEVVIDPRDIPNTALDDNLWDPEQFEEEEEEEDKEDKDGDEVQNKQKPTEQPAEPVPSAETVALMDKALAPDATMNDQITALATFMKDTDPGPASNPAPPNPSRPKPPQPIESPARLAFRDPRVRAAIADCLQWPLEDVAELDPADFTDLEWIDFYSDFENNPPPDLPPCPAAQIRKKKSR